MQAEFFSDPNLDVALALAVGLTMQVVASHLKIPGIVLLLAAGVLLGPDYLNIIRPEVLGPGLNTAVGFAVAVILFEGGMALHPKELRKESKAIRQLITIGALVTFAGATLVCKYVMDWNWSLAALFGSLVIVTGPTVINPLMRRLNVERGVASLLEAEGVLIDPIGALIAFITLELVIKPTGLDFALSVPELLLRLGIGSMFGVAGGLFLWLTLGKLKIVPEDYANVFTLAWVLALYHISDGVFHETGIAAVTVAGMVTRFMGVPVERELLEFKEQLTVMLISLLFVLLAANVRVADVQALGWPGVLTVVGLMVLVRPACVFIGTLGTGLSWQEKAFMSFMGPRGIVAAAVASLFAVQMAEAGLEGGEQLRALVFLVISITVVIAGLAGGPVARALGLKRPSDQGWVIAGAGPLARALGTSLQGAGEEVVLLDVNLDHVRRAKEMELQVLCVDALKDRTQDDAEMDTRSGAVGMTSNEEVNFLFAQKSRKASKIERSAVALRQEQSGITRPMVHEAGSQLLFGRAHDFELWADWVVHGQVVAEHRRYIGADMITGRDLAESDLFLPLVAIRSGDVAPVMDRTRFRKKDEVVFLIPQERAEQVRQLLDSMDWTTVAEPLTRNMALEAPRV